MPDPNPPPAPSHREGTSHRTARRCRRLAAWLVAVALLLVGGCASFKQTDVDAQQLAHVSSQFYDTDWDQPAPTPEPRVHRVTVTAMDGRSRIVWRFFDAVVFPRRGPARVFRHPVLARIRDGMLEVRGANRPTARIRVEDVRRVELTHR